MRSSIAAAAAALFVALLAGQSLPALGGTEQEARAVPPDRAAYEAAMAVPDLKERYERLEGFLAGFPESPFRGMAHQALLDIVIALWPEDEARIRRQIEELVAPFAEDGRSGVYDNVARKLLAGRVMLEEAEAYARRSLALIDRPEYEEQYIGRARSAYAARNETPPEDEVLRARFRSARSLNLSTLGCVLLARGRVEEARAVLEEALAGDRVQVAASACMAEIAESAGEVEAALAHLGAALLSGHARDADRKKYETLYRSTGRRAGGEDDYLDDLYRKLFPPLPPPARYEPGPARSDRVVLAEVFTGAGCNPCLGVDLAFDSLLLRYGREELVVLMYHVPVPRPDPLSNDATRARHASYGVKQAPVVVIDGAIDHAGGGPRDMAPRIFERLREAIDRRLEVKAGAELNVEVVRGGRQVVVSIAARKPAEGETRAVCALVETETRYSGENGFRFHPMVVRALAGADGRGLELQEGETLRHVFDLDEVQESLDVNSPPIDPSRLAVAAFLQDSKTGEILQAAWARLASQSL